MYVYAVVLGSALLYWAVGMMLLHHDGLARVTGVAMWGVGGGNIGHVLWIAGAVMAGVVLVRARRHWRQPELHRRRSLVIGVSALLLLSAAVAATPFLLEFVGAAMGARQVRLAADPQDRVRLARQVTLARSRAAIPFLRRLMAHGDPLVSFEAAYGLALLKGAADPAIREALVDGADAVYDGEEFLPVRVDSVLICELYSVTRDLWPPVGALVSHTWTATEDFRAEWPSARDRWQPAMPLLMDRLASLPAEADPEVPPLVAALAGPGADAAETALEEYRDSKVAPEIARALRAPASFDHRVRLSRIGRRIWSRRDRD